MSSASCNHNQPSVLSSFQGSVLNAASFLSIWALLAHENCAERDIPTPCGVGAGCAMRYGPSHAVAVNGGRLHVKEVHSSEVEEGLHLWAGVGTQQEPYLTLASLASLHQANLGLEWLSPRMTLDVTTGAC